MGNTYSRVHGTGGMMNRYTFYYNTSQEDYISGRDMRQYEIQAKDFQEAFRAYADFFENLDSYKVSYVHYCCNSSLRAIPDKYIHLVNTHLL